MENDKQIPFAKSPAYDLLRRPIVWSGGKSWAARLAKYSSYTPEWKMTNKS